MILIEPNPLITINLLGITEFYYSVCQYLSDAKLTNTNIDHIITSKIPLTPPQISSKIYHKTFTFIWIGPRHFSLIQTNYGSWSRMYKGAKTDSWIWWFLVNKIDCQELSSIKFGFAFLTVFQHKQNNIHRQKTL